MIQISSGFFKGLKLKSPPSTTRPSSERLRQAIFNILRNYRWNLTQDSIPILENATVIDLFAGSGAWGLEALSNGAIECILVENNKECFAILSANAKLILSKKDDVSIQCICKDAISMTAKLPVSRVVFCDPPYDKGFFKPCVDQLVANSCTENNGLFIYEAAEREEIEPEYALKADLKLFDRKNYGDSAVYFFVKR